MKNPKTLIRSLTNTCWIWLILAMDAAADIPATEQFVGKNAPNDGAFSTLFWLMAQGVKIVIAGIAAFFVFTIGKGVMKKYNDITNERGSWIDLGGHVVGGVALLALTILMMNWADTWVQRTPQAGS